MAGFTLVAVNIFNSSFKHFIFFTLFLQREDNVSKIADGQIADGINVL